MKKKLHQLTSKHGRLPSVPSRLDHLLGLVVGRQHAHVERHRPHHSWPGTPEQPPGAFLADDASERVADALVVAALVGGERRVCLHPDQRKVGRGTHERAQTPRGEPRPCLLVQRQRLAVGHAFLQSLGQRGEDAEARRRVCRLAEEPRREAAVEARDAGLLDDLAGDGELGVFFCFFEEVSGSVGKKKGGRVFFLKEGEGRRKEKLKKTFSLPARRSRRAAA